MATPIRSDLRCNRGMDRSIHDTIGAMIPPKAMIVAVAKRYHGESRRTQGVSMGENGILPSMSYGAFRHSFNYFLHDSFIPHSSRQYHTVIP